MPKLNKSFEINKFKELIIKEKLFYIIYQEPIFAISIFHLKIWMKKWNQTKLLYMERELLLADASNHHAY